MQKFFASFGKVVTAAALGTFIALGIWRAYADYTDFRAMRVWVAQMQQLQAEAQKAQQKPAAQVQQAPAEVK